MYFLLNLLVKRAETSEDRLPRLLVPTLDRGVLFRTRRPAESFRAQNRRVQASPSLKILSHALKRIPAGKTCHIPPPGTTNTRLRCGVFNRRHLHELDIGWGPSQCDSRFTIPMHYTVRRMLSYWPATSLSGNFRERLEGSSFRGASPMDPLQRAVLQVQPVMARNQAPPCVTVS